MQRKSSEEWRKGSSGAHAAVEAQTDLSDRPAPEEEDGGGSGPIVDLHSHLVPGVDDGAADVEAALAALQAMIVAGVRRLVTTPHVNASEIGRPERFAPRHRAVREQWDKVRRAAEDAEFAGEVGLGYEILLDDPNPYVQDERVRLGGGPYVLVEFYLGPLPPGSDEVLARIVARDVIPIVAHVERYDYGVRREDTWSRWRDAGARLQVNAGSVVGRWGERAEFQAWDALACGQCDLLASDFHARGRPWIREALEALEGAGAAEQADLLYRVNPGRVMDGEGLLPVPPVQSSPTGESRGLLDWLRRFGRG